MSLSGYRPHTRVNPHNLQMVLSGCDSYTVKYLVNGFTFGFRLGCVRKPPPRDPPVNHPPVVQNIEAARELVYQEVRLGQVLGPFKQCPLPGLICSSLNLVPKANGPKGSFRLIHNLAWPYDQNSVNSNIPDEHAHVAYIPFNNTIKICQSLGAGCFIGKEDFDAAFHLIPISGLDLNLLGFTLDGNFFVNSSLAFGARSSCCLFEVFSTSIQFALVQWTGWDTALHYLDDFLLARGSYAECARYMAAFESLTEFVGAPLSLGKREGPATKLTFFGIEIDTVKQVIEIPVQK